MLSISFWSYADDTQLYVAVFSDDTDCFYSSTRTKEITGLKTQRQIGLQKALVRMKQEILGSYLTLSQ